MAKSCAPVRDQQVAQLREISDIVETFRGILETMSVMKLDMANCLLDSIRKDVIAHSVTYEREKFQEFLKLYTCKSLAYFNVALRLTIENFLFQMDFPSQKTGYINSNQLTPQLHVGNSTL